MLLVENKYIQEEVNNKYFNLNYPYILISDEEVKSDNREYVKQKQNFINVINEEIKEDVLSFREVIEDDVQIEHLKKFTLNVMTEPQIFMNRHGILSISMEFSQRISLYNVSYINTYNYDLDLGRKIILSDIFDKDSDYIEKIVEDIKVDMKDMIRINQYNEEEYRSYKLETEYIDEMDIILYEDQEFYIENDGVVLCFSSFEISNEKSSLLEFKVPFKEYNNYLSRYAKEVIWNE